VQEKKKIYINRSLPGEGEKGKTSLGLIIE
jgi:hypothetical protein